MRGVSGVDQRPSAAPRATGLGGVRVRVGTSPELPRGLSCRVGRSVAASTGGTTLAESGGLAGQSASRGRLIPFGRDTGRPGAPGATGSRGRFGGRASQAQTGGAYRAR